MPISSYDRLFGAKKGAAEETLQALIKRYGQKQGTSVFYALVAKRKKLKRYQ